MHGARQSRGSPHAILAGARDRFGALLAALLLVVLALGSGCPRSKPPARFTSVLAGGVRLSRLAATDVPKGPRVQAQPGDFVLENARVHVVVAASAPLREGGSIVDATATSFADDQLGGLTPALQVAGRLEPLELSSVSPELSGERPELRVVHEARQGELRLTTRIRLLPNQPVVVLMSELENLSSRARRVRLGDRVRWHTGVPFVPGVGFVDGELVARARWLARAGRRQAYALAFAAAPAEAEFRSGLAERDEQWVFAEERALGPSERISHSRTLCVSSGSLEQVAELAWRAAGVEPGWVEGELRPIPDWAEIQARDSSGRVIMSGRSRNGRFRLPLPPGPHVVTLHVAGGSDERSVAVTAGHAQRLAFIVPRAAELSFVVTDEDERALPARLILRGVPPTPDPNLGPVHAAAGAHNVACTAGGSGTLALPPGRYHVLVTHGPEHSIFESTVEVTSERGAPLRARLAHAVATPGWVAADFHLHAEPSADSDVSLPDRVTTLLAEGIELAVATDHNHVTDYAPAVRALSVSDRIGTVPGIEITTPSWGHFNAFPYPLTAPLPSFAEAPPRVLFEQVKSAAPGAVVQVNHPRMGEIGYFEVGRLESGTLQARDGFSLDFDSIEVWNGFDLDQPRALEAAFLDWMKLLNAGRRYVGVGNSDSHQVVQQWAGYPRTYVYVDDDRVDSGLVERVLAGLRAGRVVVSSGPFIELEVEGERPGSLVRARAGRVAVRVAVRAPAWIGLDSAEIWVDGKPALHLDPNAPDSLTKRDEQGTLSYSGSLELARDAFVLVTARAASSLSRVLPGVRAPSAAFTNPIFVDVDGDGAFTPASAAPQDGGAPAPPSTAR